MSDVRHAVRQAIRDPGLSIVVIVMLAVGIGATTAVYSVFHEILVRPLPVPEPERLVNLGAPGLKPGSTNCTTAGDCSEVFSYPMFRDLEAQQGVFSGIGAHREFDANLAYDGDTLWAPGLLVSGGYFSTLNLRPAKGRLIGSQDEARIDESAVVVLSYDYWSSQFGAQESVIGRTLTVNGQALTIVGVAPEGFVGTTIGVRPKVFVPVTLRGLMEPNVPGDSTMDRRAYWLYVFGRLAPGVSLEQATVNLNGAYALILSNVEAAQQIDLSAEDLQRFRERRITVESGGRGQSWVPSTSAPVLTILLGAASLVLVIVCVNVASLLLARGASRAGEMAIRASIGAGRRQLAFQLLTEAGVLAVAGGLLSLPVAYATLAGIISMAPSDVAAAPWEIGDAAMLFGAVATLGTVLLFGLAPALRAARADPGTVMKGNAAHVLGNRTVVGFRSVLATAQIAFSTVLLVMAGLFAQSLLNLTRTDLGMDVDSVLAFTVSPRLNGYSPEQVMNLYAEIEGQVGAQSGVTAVGSSSVRLLANNVSGAVIDIEGFERGYPTTRAVTNHVSSGFFTALSIPFKSGRDFTAADRLLSPRVAIVNESFVRKFNLGEQPIGTRFGLDSPSRDVEIVGVVGDAKYNQVRADIPPQIFLSRLQNPFLGTMTFYIRADVDPATLSQTTRQTLARMDPNLPLVNLATLQSQARENVFLDRLVTALSASLAVVATLLAAIGLYGVLAFNVVQRTRELGLRLALGAAPVDVERMVLKQVGAKALMGGGVGLVAAIGIGRASEALLFGISGHDPLVLIVAVTVLGGVVLSAGYLPARRASRVAPMEALRHD
jgi:putative ABC transport system permease protein